MLRPTAVEVTPLNNYCLKIRFDNNEIKVFDVTPYIKGSWFGMLSNTDYFKRVSVNKYSVEWPDGQDICPDELYFNSTKIIHKPGEAR